MFGGLSIRKCCSFCMAKRVRVRVFTLFLVVISLVSLVFQRTLLEKTSAYTFLGFTSPLTDNKSLVWLNKEEGGDIVVACKLPELDPFHPSVINFIRDLGKLHCEGTNYSNFENNILRVEGKDIVSAQYRKIERTPGNDFGVVLSDPVTIQNQSRDSVHGGLTGIPSYISLHIHQAQELNLL